MKRMRLTEFLTFSCSVSLFRGPRRKKNRRSERWRISPTACKRWASDGQATSWRKFQNFKPPFSLTECPKLEARGKQQQTSTKLPNAAKPSQSSGYLMFTHHSATRQISPTSHYSKMKSMMSTRMMVPCSLRLFDRAAVLIRKL